MTADLERWQATQDRRLDSHSDDIDALKLWRAEVRGSLRTLQIVVGVAMGLPAFALGVLALTGGIG